MALSFSLRLKRPVAAAPFQKVCPPLPFGREHLYKEKRWFWVLKFFFFKKSPSLIFAILLFAAVASSPVVPPTLSSPPFSSSSVCIPGFVVEKESTSTVSVVEKPTTTTTKTNPKLNGRHHHIIFRLDGCHIGHDNKKTIGKKKKKIARAFTHLPVAIVAQISIRQ